MDGIGVNVDKSLNWTAYIFTIVLYGYLSFSGNYILLLICKYCTRVHSQRTVYCILPVHFVNTDVINPNSSSSKYVSVS